MTSLQPPCHTQGRRPPRVTADQAAQGPIHAGLEHLRGWTGIHSLSGQLFQHLTTLIAKNFPLTSNLYLPFLNLKLFPLVPCCKRYFPYI